MKNFKQFMCLVLAFLMVCTSISWNGFQVHATDSTDETNRTYYFYQTFEEGENEIGTFTDNGLTTADFTSDSIHAKKITSSNGVYFVANLSEEITSDIADIVYIEMDIISETGQLPEMRFYAGGKCLWNTNISGNQIRKESDSTLFIAVESDTIHRFGTKIDLVNGTTAFYEIDKTTGEWSTEALGTEDLAPTAISTFYYRFTNDTVRDFIIDNLKVYTITEVEEVITEAAEIDGTRYDTFYGEGGALAAAAEGKTIKLLNNVTKETETTIANIVLSNGVDIDLNGCTLETGYLVAFDGSMVVDNSDANAGLLKVSTGNIVFSGNNSQMPVLDTDGYRFATVAENVAEGANTTTIAGFESEYIYLIMEPSLGSAVNELLKDGAANNEIQIGVRLSWAKEDTTHVQDCYFKDAYVISSYVSTSDATVLNFMVGGLENFEGIKANVLVTSDLGVEYVGATGFEVKTPSTTTE